MAGTLGVICIGIACCLGGTLLPAAAIAATATDSVKSAIDQVVTVLEDKELKKADRAMERRQRLHKIFNDRFNYEEMSKRALGAQWNNMNETQRQQFVDLFRQLLARTIPERLKAIQENGFSTSMNIMRVTMRRSGQN